MPMGCAVHLHSPKIPEPSRSTPATSRSKSEPPQKPADDLGGHARELLEVPPDVLAVDLLIGRPHVLRHPGTDAPLQDLAPVIRAMGESDGCTNPCQNARNGSVTTYRLSRSRGVASTEFSRRSARARGAPWTVHHRCSHPGVREHEPGRETARARTGRSPRWPRTRYASLHLPRRHAPGRHQKASRMPPTKLRGAPANTEPVVLARTPAPFCRPETALIELARFWAEAM